MTVIAVRGLVAQPPCGVTDYGVALAQALARQGLNVDVQLQAPGGSLWRRLMTWPRLANDDRLTIWQYSSFSYAYRGVSMPAAIYPVYAKLRRRTTIAVMHELFPDNFRDLKSFIVWISQVLAAIAICLFSDAVVVTTDRRVKQCRSLGARRVFMIPVYSNWPSDPASGEIDSRRVTIPSWGQDGVDPVLIAEAMRGTGYSLLLLGAPSPETLRGQAWVSACKDADVSMQFSGILSAAEAAYALATSLLILSPSNEGPSSRKTTLAAALASGRPTIAFDGPNTWLALRAARVVKIVHPKATELRSAIEWVSAGGREVSEMTTRASAFVEAEFSLDSAASRFTTLINLLRATRYGSRSA